MDVMELVAFLLAYLLIVSVLRLFSRLKNKHRVSNLPPGPWKLPLIGNIHQLFGDLPHRVMCDLAKKYGPLMHLQLGEVSHVVVSSPEIAKLVMKTHDAIFASRPHIMVSKIVSYDSAGITFSPYGKYWRQLRRIGYSELFSPKRVLSFHSIREEETLNFVKWVACHEGKPINFTKKIYSLIYATTSIVAFGKKNEDQELFIKLTLQILELAAGFNIADLYPSVKLFQSISGVKPTLEKLHSQIDTVLEKIIIHHKKDSTGIYQDCKDLVDVLLKHQDEFAEPHLTNANIKAVLLDIFIAGGDSSATVIVWAMSEMIRNPSILRRAQEEVRMTFTNEGYVNESKFDDLKYIESIIKETLRLHPPGTLLLPRQNSESVKINGYEIPAKTKVIINAWAINRDPSYWQDANCFKPERFLDSLIDYKGKHFEYIPFGAGRRMCPGINLGLANVLLPLTNLLYYFDWELPNEMKCEDLCMEERFGALVSRKHDLYVIPKIRNHLSFPC